MTTALVLFINKQALLYNMYKFDKNILIKDLRKLHRNLSRRPTRHDNNSLYQKSRKYFGSWNKMMENAGYKVKYYQYPKIPSKLTQDLSYFLGLIITDGHLQNKSKYGIYLYTSYEEEKDMILNLIKGLFDYRAYLVFRKFGFNKRINIQIAINSKKLVNCLNKKFDIPTGNKSLIVRVPKIILNSNRENKINFLRGVIDGDGHITQSSVHISSGSYLFLLDLKKLLFDIKIECNAKIEKRRTCYVLHLNKTESKKLYYLCYNNAKYFYPRKKEKLLRTNIFKNIKLN